MTEPESVKLLPCPFCGEAPSVDQHMDEDLATHNIVPWQRVRCIECGVGFELPDGYEDNAFDQWNRRTVVGPAQPPSSVTDAMVEAGAKAMHDLKYDESGAWDKATLAYQDFYRKGTRVCLEAALSASAAGEIEPVNLPFERMPHCACDDGSGPAWSIEQYKLRSAACKLRGGPCQSPQADPAEAGAGSLREKIVRIIHRVNEPISFAESRADEILATLPQGERLWCRACGTVTRDGICDCNRYPEDHELAQLASEWEKLGRILRSEREADVAEAYETCAKYLREVLATQLVTGDRVLGEAQALVNVLGDAKATEEADIDFLIDELQRSTDRRGVIRNFRHQMIHCGATGMFDELNGQPAVPPQQRGGGK